MPLLPGEENIGHNIEELKKDGFTDPKQRIAIALKKSREKKEKPAKKGKPKAKKEPVSE